MFDHQFPAVLAFSADQSATQRRAVFRVTVPPDSNLSVGVWKITERASLLRTPLSVYQISSRARDLTQKGMGIFLLPPGPQTWELATGDRVQVRLQVGDQTAVLEGRVQMHANAPGSSDGWPEHAGVEFHFDLNRNDSRQALTALTQIIGQVRREEGRVRSKA